MQPINKDFQKRKEGFEFHVSNSVKTFGIGFGIDAKPANLFTRLFFRFIKVQTTLMLVDQLPKPGVRTL